MLTLPISPHYATCFIQLQVRRESHAGDLTRAHDLPKIEFSTVHDLDMYTWCRILPLKERTLCHLYLFIEGNIWPQEPES